MDEYTSIRVKKSTLETLNNIKKPMGCSHEFLILKMAEGFKNTARVWYICSKVIKYHLIAIGLCMHAFILWGPWLHKYTICFLE